MRRVAGEKGAVLLLAGVAVEDGRHLRPPFPVLAGQFRPVEARAEHPGDRVHVTVTVLGGHLVQGGCGRQQARIPALQLRGVAQAEKQQQEVGRGEQQYRPPVPEPDTATDRTLSRNGAHGRQRKHCTQAVDAQVAVIEGAARHQPLDEFIDDAQADTGHGRGRVPGQAAQVTAQGTQQQRTEHGVLHRVERLLRVVPQRPDQAGKHAGHRGQDQQPRRRQSGSRRRPQKPDAERGKRNQGGPEKEVPATAHGDELPESAGQGNGPPDDQQPTRHRRPRPPCSPVPARRCPFHPLPPLCSCLSWSPVCVRLCRYAVRGQRGSSGPGRTLSAARTVADCACCAK